MRGELQPVGLTGREGGHIHREGAGLRFRLSVTFEMVSIDCAAMELVKFSV